MKYYFPPLAVVIMCLSDVEHRRHFFLRAREAGLANGQYAFLLYWFTPSTSMMEPWVGWKHEHNTTMVKMLKEAMMAAKVVRTQRTQPHGNVPWGCVSWQQLIAEPSLLVVHSIQPWGHSSWKQSSTACSFMFMIHIEYKDVWHALQWGCAHLFF